MVDEKYHDPSSGAIPADEEIAIGAGVPESAEDEAADAEDDDDEPKEDDSE